MILQGKVTSGIGEASFWVAKIKDIFKEKTNMELYLGTLNIKLKEKYEIKDNYILIHKEEYGGTQELYVQPCKVLGHSAYIIRTENNASGKGDHPLDLIEILSDINFRKTYKLKDNDLIKVEV